MSIIDETLMGQWIEKYASKPYRDKPYEKKLKSMGYSLASVAMHPATLAPIERWERKEGNNIYRISAFIGKGNVPYAYL